MPFDVFFLQMFTRAPSDPYWLAALRSPLYRLVVLPLSSLSSLCPATCPCRPQCRLCPPTCPPRRPHCLLVLFDLLRVLPVLLVLFLSSTLNTYTVNGLLIGIAVIFLFLQLTSNYWINKEINESLRARINDEALLTWLHVIAPSAECA